MSETKLKHLEFIHNTINRMAQNSFLAKGWLISLIIACITFLEKDKSSSLLVLFTLITLSCIVFWVLDAFYLRQERLFRQLYNEVISEKSTVPVLSMNTSGFSNKVDCLFHTMFSISVLPIYLPIFIIGVVGIICQIWSDFSNIKTLFC